MGSLILLHTPSARLGKGGWWLAIKFTAPPGERERLSPHHKPGDGSCMEKHSKRSGVSAPSWKILRAGGILHHLHDTQRTEASGGSRPVVYTFTLWGRLVRMSPVGEGVLWQQLHMRELERTPPKGVSKLDEDTKERSRGCHARKAGNRVKMEGASQRVS